MKKKYKINKIHYLDNISINDLFNKTIIDFQNNNINILK